MLVLVIPDIHLNESIFYYTDFFLLCQSFCYQCRKKCRIFSAVHKTSRTKQLKLHKFHVKK